MTGTGEAVLFWIAAPIMVLAALGLVFTKRAVYAALCMVLTMITLGIVYITQGAEFLGLVHVFVYTGAVMMLFLFVVMLVGVDASDSTIDALKGQKWWGLALGLGLAALLIVSIAGTVFPPAPPIAQMNAEGNVTGLAYLIFGRYLGVFNSSLPCSSPRRWQPWCWPTGSACCPSPRSWVEPEAGARQPARRGSARPRRVRPPQRGRHAGAAARRHAQRAVDLARARLASAAATSGRVHAPGRGDRPRDRGRFAPMSLTNYLYLSAALFAIGASTVLIRRNAIIVFMGVELMLNAVNLSFVTFSRMNGHLDGQAIALFVMAVAAAEVVVGLGIIMAIFRARRSASVDAANLLKL